MVEPWPLIASETVGDFRIFQIRRDWKRSPRTGREHDFYVIDTVPWVNVIALTPSNEVVLVEQFRHGTNTVELEIPGGMMDGDESPEAAGVRELREETGYEGGSARTIGQIHPNPAIMSNVCYTVLVEDCSLKHATDFDHTEDVHTRLRPAADLPSLVRSGQIRHALVAVAIFHFELWRMHPSPAGT